MPHNAVSEPCVTSSTDSKRAVVPRADLPSKQRCGMHLAYQGSALRLLAQRRLLFPDRCWRGTVTLFERLDQPHRGYIECSCRCASSLSSGAKAAGRVDMEVGYCCDRPDAYLAVVHDGCVSAGHKVKFPRKPPDHSASTPGLPLLCIGL